MDLMLDLPFPKLAPMDLTKRSMSSSHQIELINLMNKYNGVLEWQI